MANNFQTKSELKCDYGISGGCASVYNCCDCGDTSGDGCGCMYCWSCNACESCLIAMEQDD